MFAIEIMEQPTVSIPKDVLDDLLICMQRAERYCQNARASVWPMSDEDLQDEATSFYSGASGYAGGTLRHVISTLEMYEHMDAIA